MDSQNDIQPVPGTPPEPRAPLSVITPSYKVFPLPLHLSSPISPVRPSSPGFINRMMSRSPSQRKRAFHRSKKSVGLGSGMKQSRLNAPFAAPTEKKRKMTPKEQADLYAAVASLKSANERNEHKAQSLPDLDMSRQAKKGEDKHKNQTSPSKETARPFTLWRYLLLELATKKTEVFTEEKTEHLLNFARVPYNLEKTITFGIMTCLDSFLHFFTILPLRFFYAIFLSFKNILLGVNERIPRSRKTDIIKGFMFIVLVLLLMQLDTSKIYHNIRGQSALKLYFMFNVLEIADKLLSAIGQGILESLFSHETLSRHYNKSAFMYYRPLFYAFMAILYSALHSVVILYQLITLNVAVNSYSNALLTLLLSNQFSEIKSAVFKKFERENLFQMTCADITERFQLTTMLFIIGLRNVVEVSNTGIVPRSWSGWNRWLGALVGPMIVVVGSEICVDWLKHAYIAKFNNIRPRVYKKFLDVLTFDYSRNSFSDDTLIKRIGIPIFPLASVFFRMLLQSYAMLAEQQASLSDFASPAIAKSVFSPNDLTLSGVIPAGLKSFSFGGKEFTIPQVLRSVFEIGKLQIISYIGLFQTDVIYQYLQMAFVFLLVYTMLFFVKLVLGLMLLKYSSNRRRVISERGRNFENEIEKLTAIDAKERKNSDQDNHKFLDVSRFKMVAKQIW